MSKKMTRFDFANKATKAMVTAAKLPLRRKSVVRSFEASKDSINDRLLDLEEIIDNKRTALYTADKTTDKTALIQAIVEARLEVSDLRQSLIVLADEATQMTEEVEVEDEDEDEDEA